MFGRIKRLLQSKDAPTPDFPTDLASDPRWQRLHSKTFKCHCCGDPMPGMFDIGYDHPDPWPHGNREATGQPILAVGDDALGTDFCMHDGQFYLRCILPIPIIGSEERFAYGPWASLSEDSMQKYGEAEKAKDFSNFTACFGWLSNLLPGFEMDAFLKANVEFGDGSLRPEIWIHEGTHPLADAQRNGISFDRLLDIYAASGNDIRPHLLDS